MNTKTYPIIQIGEHLYSIGDNQVGPNNYYIYGNKLCLSSASVDKDCLDKGIVFTTNPELGLPLLPPIKEDVEQLAEKDLKAHHLDKDDMMGYGRFKGFLEGYKTNKGRNVSQSIKNAMIDQTKMALKVCKTDEDIAKILNNLVESLTQAKWTDEDIRKAYLQIPNAGGEFNGEKIEENFQKYLKSLKKVPIAVCLEMAPIPDVSPFSDKDNTWNNVRHYEPKVENNYVKVVKWIYDN